MLYQYIMNFLTENIFFLDEYFVNISYVFSLLHTVMKNSPAKSVNFFQLFFTCLLALLSCFVVL